VATESAVKTYISERLGPVDEPTYVLRVQGLVDEAIGDFQRRMQALPAAAEYHATMESILKGYSDAMMDESTPAALTQVIMNALYLYYAGVVSARSTSGGSKRRRTRTRKNRKQA
jgi:predicted transcriptional regulator